MAKIWSTAEVHPRDRLAYWVDAVCDGTVHFDCTAPRDQPFFGEIRIDVAGQLRTAGLTGTAQLVTRSPHQIARDPADDLALTVHRSGDNLFTQTEHEAALRPGDLVLHDMTRPLRIRIDTQFAQTVLLFPRAALKSRIGAIEPYVGGTIDGTTGMGGMLSPLLAALPAQLDAIPAAARERLGENVLDLIATTLLSQRENPPLSVGMTLARIKLWIETHLGENLSAERIAGAGRVSMRYLNRLFEREETSLMRYVWDRRLARCRRDLTDPQMRGRPVGEIAFAAGFNDLTHFSRAYRARFGCAPRDARRAASAADAPDRCGACRLSSHPSPTSSATRSVGISPTGSPTI
jgi:AraC family transcriptional regulator, positive regulator of tynA and feaB